MPPLQKQISEVELKWKSLLFEGARQIFAHTNLPSHNHWHHYRVWQYAKELIEVASTIRTLTYNEIEHLIVAIFFHDTGMSITRDESHGKESKIICEDFFRSGNIRPPEGFHHALKAIEEHDDKTTLHTGKKHNISVKLLVSTADDLDAFGYIGILRYAEIYLLRGIQTETLGHRVINNAAKRFQNFKTIFGNKALTNRHLKRYEILQDFYKNMHKRENNKIIDHIKEKVFKTKPEHLKDLIYTSDNKSISQYFHQGLEKELKLFHSSTII